MTLFSLPASALDTKNTTGIGVDNTDTSVEIISSSAAHSVRSEEVDNLYTTVVDNKDGTHTMTLHDHPVKFIGENGEIEDISFEITASKNGGYETAASIGKTVFPQKISEGITLSGNGVNLKLTPQKAVAPIKPSTVSLDSVANRSLKMIDSAVTKLDTETVSYVYDSKTSFEYSLTYTGFKEDLNELSISNLIALKKIACIECDNDGSSLYNVSVYNDDNFEAWDQYKYLYEELYSRCSSSSDIIFLDMTGDSRIRRQVHY